MNRKTKIIKEIGISQPEVAMILGVHLSQWSMYSSGKRDLPERATLILDEMLEHLDAAIKSEKLQKAENKIEQSKIESMLKENKFRQDALNYKIAITINKKEAQSKAILIYEFLENREPEKSYIMDLHNVLAKKMRKAFSGDIAVKLLEQQHEVEMLVYEKTLLEEKLAKLRSGK